MDQKELLKLKEKIDESKTKISELTGRKDYLLQQLDDRWECKNVSAGEKLLQRMSKDIQKLQEDIQARTAELKEHYDV